MKALTAKELAGREAASEGERMADDYVAGQLRGWGVEPLGEFRHPFPFGAGESANVLGAVRGKRKDEWVVIGAHVDHLGKRGDAIWWGAEDNASGVAVVLEIAHELAGRKAELDRSVLFAFFGAEEAGMVGSHKFVDAPPVPLASISTMVNVDMIGRPLVDQADLAFAKIAVGMHDEHAVGLVGAKDRPDLRKIADDACAGEAIRVWAAEDMPAPIAAIIEKQTRARGDNWSFEQKGIPALFFGSGESDDYHRPTDTADRLRPDIMAPRARAILAAVIALSRKPGK